MKKARLTAEQIIGILQEHEAGAKCAGLCRKHGMSEGAFYAWKAKYSGMTVLRVAIVCHGHIGGPLSALPRRGPLHIRIGFSGLEVDARKCSVRRAATRD